MLDSIARLRRFNRIVTREIGALESSYLGRGRPLGVARVFHLISESGTEVGEIRRQLALDNGLLSRILRGLEGEGLIRLDPDPVDRRRRTARLTESGRAEWQVYEQLGLTKAQTVFDRAGARQQAMIEAMDLIATIMLRDEVEVRDADPSDPAALACIAAYYRYLAQTVPGVGPDDFTLPLADPEAYRGPTGAFLVAWSDNLPVGCVSLRALEPGVAEVKRLWVDPLARGQGLGLRLMQALESRARDMGYVRARLDSNTALTEAIALYRSHGWVETAAYTDPPANIWMTKRL